MEFDFSVAKSFGDKSGARGNILCIDRNSLGNKVGLGQLSQTIWDGRNGRPHAVGREQTSSASTTTTT